ncbi:hypothetical protein [Streptomyces sp. sk226]|nr:hypothetical protein [Streptomyces sp. sk226]
MIATLSAGEQIAMAVTAVAALGLAVFGVRRARRTARPGDAE